MVGRGMHHRPNIQNQLNTMLTPILPTPLPGITANDLTALGFSFIPDFGGFYLCPFGDYQFSLESQLVGPAVACLVLDEELLFAVEVPDKAALVARVFEIVRFLNGSKRYLLTELRELAEEISQIAPENSTSETWEEPLDALVERLTECCRKVDPESTDEVLQDEREKPVRLRSDSK